MVYSTEIAPAGWRALSWVVVSVTLTIVGLRLWLRLKFRTYGLDDYTIFLASVLFLIGTSLGQAKRDNPGTTIEDTIRLSTLDIFDSLVSAFTLVLARFSVGIFLLRVLGTTYPWSRRTIHVCLALQVCALFFYLAPLGRPQCDAADPATLMYNCMHKKIGDGIGRTFNVYGAFMDIAFSIIPVTFTYRLHTSKEKKTCVCLLLGLGWTAGAFALLRELYSAVNPAAPLQSFILLLSSSMESGLVMICGSLGAISHFFKSWNFGRPWASLNSEGGTNPPPKPVVNRNEHFQNMTARDTSFAASDRANDHSMRRALIDPILPAVHNDSRFNAQVWSDNAV